MSGAERYHVTEYGAYGSFGKYVAGSPATHAYVALRHGVILGSGDTAAAAAAAAAAAVRVSRCEVRLATPYERRMARRIANNGRMRPLPETESALLEAIHIDITRLLFLDDNGSSSAVGPDIAEYKAIDDRLNYCEWERILLDDDERAELEERAEAILDELRELAFLERQIDAFAPEAAHAQ